MSAREDFTDHLMPSGESCFYRDGDHSYFGEIKPKAKTKPEGDWCGVAASRLLGVSTAAGAADFQPDGLMKWAARTNGVGIAQLVADTLAGIAAAPDAGDVAAAFAWCDNAASIWEALTEAELTYDQLREQRADEGTNVHKHALYALASGKPVPDYDELTEVEKGYAGGISEFWLEHAPIVHHAEQVVMDAALGVAGRLDLRAHLPLYGDTFLIDAKTSGFIPIKHHVQLAGYEHCSRVSGLGETAGQLILQVTPDGEYELVDSHGTREDFFAAVDMYRRVKRIGKAAADDRKAVAA